MANHELVCALLVEAVVLPAEQHRASGGMQRGGMT